MGNYVRKLEEVQAVRAKENNINEIEKIAGKVQKITPTHGKESYYIVGLPQVLWVGDWLIKHSSGRLEILSNAKFLQEYEIK